MENFNYAPYKNITVVNKYGEPVAVIFPNGEAIIYEGYDILINVGEYDE
ncbi:hypothetical protein AKUA2103_PHAGE100090 (plasmid) [Apilactobacillus kunkeei]|nr:hypothetical protein AKUA2103_PHAGE100090 [Apilactobacillus kunkeei]CAI2699075.1 hypothetical protein AKUA1003_PHAGE100090 [Apilactobacillus kunkeei]